MLILQNKGFTLAELLIVGAIVAILSVVGGASIMLTSGNTFSVDRAEVLNTFIRTRNMASRRSECVRLSITVTSQIRVEAFAASSGRICTGPFLVPLRDPIIYDYGNLTISNFRAGPSDIGRELMFNAAGGLTIDQLLTFQVSDAHGNLADFRIYPALGQTRVR